MSSRPSSRVQFSVRRVLPKSWQRLVDADLDVTGLRELLSAPGVSVEPLSADDAELAGAMRALDGGRTLSLGDRCCLALTVRSTPPEVLTADHAWIELDLPMHVRLIR